MSVYTEVSKPCAQAICQQFSLGQFVGLTPIAAGVENTNYFLHSDQDWVLTVFESLSSSQVEPVLALQQAMRDAGLPVAQVAQPAADQLVSTYHGKPMTIVERLPGAHGEASEAHIAAIGQFLSRFHLQDFPLTLAPSVASIDWVGEQLDGASFESFDAIAQALADIREAPRLPAGIVHGDLFPDNALFQGDQLSGVIDWYFAGYDYYLWDLAVATVAWCGSNAQKEAVLLNAYQRPLTASEQQLWPAFKVVAAARFWLSRRQAEQAPKQALVTQKPAQEMYDLMHHYLQESDDVRL